MSVKIRCAGCGCPIDPMLDVALRVKYGDVHPWFCSANCLVDFVDAMIPESKHAEFFEKASPPNWRKLGSVPETF